MPINRKRKQRSEIEAKKLLLLELSYTDMVKSGTFRLASGKKKR